MRPSRLCAPQWRRRAERGADTARRRTHPASEATLPHVVRYTSCAHRRGSPARAPRTECERLSACGEGNSRRDGRLPLHPRPDQELLILDCPPRAITAAVDIPYRFSWLVDAVRRHHDRVRAFTLGPDTLDDALQAARAADVILLSSVDAFRDAGLLEVMRRVALIERPAIGLALGLPTTRSLCQKSAPTWPPTTTPSQRSPPQPAFSLAMARMRRTNSYSNEPYQTRCI